MMNDGTMQRERVMEHLFLARCCPRFQSWRVRLLPFACLVLAAGIALGDENEDRLGTLTGRFVYDGEPPQPPVVAAPIIGAPPFRVRFRDESLLVNNENFGIANVVVSLYLGRGEPAPPIARDRLDQRVDIDVRNFQFVPHVSWVQTSQPVRITNRMKAEEMPQLHMLKNPPLNLALPPNGRHDFRFDHPERLPVLLTSSLHPWMSGQVVVTDHPFVSISDLDGTFRIERLPPGPWRFRFWHERPGYVTKGHVDGKEHHWKKGLIHHEVKAGRNRLGQIKLPPGLFHR